MKKLFILFIVMVLNVCPVFADETQKFLTIDKMKKGLNTHISEYILDNTQASQADNVRFNNRLGTFSKRPINLLYGSAGSHTIESMHRFYKSDGTVKLIVQGSTKLYVGDDDAGTFSVIGSGYTDKKRMTWETYKDHAIGSNGYEQPVKYDGNIDITADTDGHRTAENCVTQLGAPFAELDTGTDLDASSWYQYKVVHYNSTTAIYYYSDARSNAILTGASVYNLALIDIPLGPSGTTSRYIYRTSGNSSKVNVLADTTFYLVDEISDNTTTTYTDGESDATIEADNAPTWATSSGGTNVTPPLMRYILIHDESLFGASNSTYLSDVYWSDTYNPDVFSPADYVQVRPDDGDEIMFLREQLGILTIAKKKTIQKLYTDTVSSSNWTLSDPFSFIGCISPYSVANTPKGIFYLAWEGLHRFTGQRSELVSDAVTPEINDILQSSIRKVAGYYYRNEYHLAYTSISSGEFNNNRVLVYDLVRDAYAKDYKEINSFVAFDSGTDFGVLYHGSSDTDGNVYADNGSTNFLFKRLKSEFDAGTFDDARTIGTESAPEIEIAWDITIDEAVGTIDGHAYGASAIIDRPDTDGTWTSPVYQIDASALDQIQWNERLGETGNITVQIKSCDDAACSGESWEAAVSDPSGSDLSGITANDYIQIRFNLSTTDIVYTPYLYSVDGFVFRIFFTKSGDTKESDVLSTWASGWEVMGNPGHKKFIRRIRVFYSGDEGTLSFTYENGEGDVSRSFDIDMTVEGDDSDEDYYTARGEDFKVYTYYPGENEDNDPAPTGEHWRFTISENGTGEWDVYKIETAYYLEELY